MQLNSDVDRLVALLTEDAWLTMPPEPLEYQGHAAIAEFFLTRSLWGLQAARLVPTRASGQPAFGYYRRDRSSPIAHARGLIVLTLAGDRISAITRSHASLIPLFGCRGPCAINAVRPPPWCPSYRAAMSPRRAAVRTAGPCGRRRFFTRALRTGTIPDELTTDRAPPAERSPLSDPG